MNTNTPVKSELGNSEAQVEVAKISERGNLKSPGRIPNRTDAGSGRLGLVESYEPVFHTRLSETGELSKCPKGEEPIVVKLENLMAIPQSVCE